MYTKIELRLTKHEGLSGLVMTNKPSGNPNIKPIYMQIVSQIAFISER